MCWIGKNLDGSSVICTHTLRGADYNHKCHPTETFSQIKPNAKQAWLGFPSAEVFFWLLTLTVTQICGFQGDPLSAHLMPPRLQFSFDPSHHQTCPHNAHVPQWACPLFTADEEIKGGRRGSPELPPCPTAYLQITPNINDINCALSRVSSVAHVTQRRQPIGRQSFLLFFLIGAKARNHL